MAFGDDQGERSRCGGGAMLNAVATFVADGGR